MTLPPGSASEALASHHQLLLSEALTLFEPLMRRGRFVTALTVAMGIGCGKFMQTAIAGCPHYRHRPLRQSRPELERVIAAVMQA
jgi:hypothetical protein